MNLQLANLSTDLRRISNWIYDGKLDLVNDVLKKVKVNYKGVSKVGAIPNIWIEIDKIAKNEGGRIRSADRATTLGSITLQEAYKK